MKRYTLLALVLTALALLVLAGCPGKSGKKMYGARDSDAPTHSMSRYR